MQDTSLLPTFVKLWMSFWWVEVIDVRCSLSFGLSKSRDWIPFTWFIPSDSKRSGNLTCTRQFLLPSTMSWFHSTGSVILGRRISECELWKSVAFILLLFTLVFFCLLMFTFVYPNRYSFRFWMWIMEISCLYFYLHLFSFVYLCLLLFIKNGIPLGTWTECELWRLDVFVLLLFSFVSFVYLCLLLFIKKNRYSFGF